MKKHFFPGRTSARRRNRPRNPLLPAGSGDMDVSLLNRWAGGDPLTASEHFLQLPDTDRILANLRSDYVDDRACEDCGPKEPQLPPHRRRKKPARTDHLVQAGRHRLTTPTGSGRNFNELWIRETSTYVKSFLDVKNASSKSWQKSRIWNLFLTGKRLFHILAKV